MEFKSLVREFAGSLGVNDVAFDEDGIARLQDLIGDVLSGPGDAKLKDKLLAKLSAGGERSLLERKVVAKVLDELGRHKAR